MSMKDEAKANAHLSYCSNFQTTLTLKRDLKIFNGFKLITIQIWRSLILVDCFI